MKTPIKQVIEIILHKFYTITCCDALNGIPIPFEGDFLPDECDDTKEYEYEEHDGCSAHGLDILTHFEIIKKICLENKNKFDKIELRRSYVEEDYSDYPRIVGIRLETDEELNDRLKKIELSKKQKEINKQKKIQEKAEKKIQKEKELLETLQAKYKK